MYAYFLEWNYGLQFYMNIYINIIHAPRTFSSSFNIINGLDGMPMQPRPRTKFTCAGPSAWNALPRDTIATRAH